MANLTIPQLPSQTAATDLDLLVIVNSGETTTSKITRADLLSGVIEQPGFVPGDASDSIVPYYYPTSSGLTANTAYVDKLYVEQNTINSNNHQLFLDTTGSTITSTKPYNAVIGGNGNSISSNYSTEGYNYIFGGIGSSITGGQVNMCLNAGSQISSSVGSWNTIIGTQAGKIQGGNRNSVIGGVYNEVQGGNSNAIVGGQNQYVSGNNNFAAASNGTLANTSNFAFIASQANGNINGGNDAFNAMIGSYFSTMGFNGAYGSVMLGGYQNYFKNFYGPGNEYR